MYVNGSNFDYLDEPLFDHKFGVSVKLSNDDYNYVTSCFLNRQFINLSLLLLVLIFV